jgi:hypothetical protein
MVSLIKEGPDNLPPGRLRMRRGPLKVGGWAMRHRGIEGILVPRIGVMVAGRGFEPLTFRL